MKRVRVSRATATIYCAAFLVVAACQSAADRLAIIEAWLSCDECIAGEREAVRNMGSDAVQPLSSALVGPSQVRQDIVRARLAQLYATLPPSSITQQQYVERYLANYIATYQKRSAISLGDIATTTARAALDDAQAQAVARAYRDDVVRTITFTRARISARAFDGTVFPRLVGFGDTVAIRRAPTSPFDLNEVPSIDGSPFPGAETIVLSNQDSIRFLATPSSDGEHTITISNVGTTTNSAVAVIAISSISDANDRAMLACGAGGRVGGPGVGTGRGSSCAATAAPAITVTSLPRTVFLTLSEIQPRPDTIDFFRFQPAAPLPVTARLNWPGSANLNLQWRRCTAPDTPIVVGPGSGGATSANPEVAAMTIPAGECWLLLVTLSNAPDGRAFARLRLNSP